MKPFFAEKNNPTKHTTLIEGDDIVSKDFKVAEVVNDFFATTISNLNIRGYEFTSCPHLSLDRISNIITSFENHPSIVKIKTWCRRTISFHSL